MESNKQFSKRLQTVAATLATVCLNNKLFSERKLHKFEPLKSCPEAINSHQQPLLGKVKTAGQGYGFRASLGGSLEWQLKP